MAGEYDHLDKDNLQRIDAAYQDGQAADRLRADMVATAEDAGHVASYVPVSREQLDRILTTIEQQS